MILWLDAHFSPALASWVTQTSGIQTQSVRELGLRDAKDDQIFQAARSANAVLMTKDADFVELIERLGPPPRVLWVTCGNTSNARLKQVLSICLANAVSLLEAGEAIVEISDGPGTYAR